MSNTHAIADTAYELQATCQDLLPACVISTTWPTVPVSSMTLSAFATQAYVRDGQALVYCDQPAITLTLTGSDGTYWVSLARDISTAYASWTRRAGSHYLWRLSGTRPPDLDGLLVFASCTVAGGVITAVTPAPGVTLAEAWRARAGLGTMAQQDANAVAITGGQAQLTRLGLSVAPVAGYSLNVAGLSYFDTAVGIGILPSGSGPTLDVNGSVHATIVGLGVAPNPANSLTTGGPVSVGANLGVTSDLFIGGNSVVTGTQRAGAYVGVNMDASTYNLNVNGNAGIPGGAWVNSTSRAALKQGIRPLAAALEILARLQPRQWEWRPEYPELERLLPGTQCGFVTEEITAALPQTAQVSPDGTLAHSERGLLALLVAAVQELTARVTALEAATGN